ncbi:DUF21-domain-containing protein [Gonapodya prolifera JEL478]|uniref:DUF21-domain-containing protein n=1 Tax=Gonapodya prolifera (strain JEL478) TaxID=1344416 RepID=A0A139AEM0_GONPJ|nr:DUF21-domain-containing protein [Gonapodya prolifera JEL478]|eukprot:KXS15262.1 DUF21-domain-containing protein [Gonapodya prolifera JEL478]
MATHYRSPLPRLLLAAIAFALLTLCALSVPLAPTSTSTHQIALVVDDTHLSRRAEPTTTELPPCKAEEHLAIGSGPWIGMLVVAIVLIAVGGLFAGLTLGMMSLDVTNLEILKQAGSPSEQKYAKIILPLRKRGHLLLITLLLGNVVVNETLPIILDNLTGGAPAVVAIVISTVVVVIFGEIIPASVIPRFGLAFGAAFTWPVTVLMYILYPLVWPIGRLLDWVIGENEQTSYERKELKALVGLHGTGQLGDLRTDEITVISGALDLAHKTVRKIMTPFSAVYALSYDAILDAQTLREIKSRGYSRIPVYRGTRDNIVGLLLVKQLVDYDPHEAKTVGEQRLFSIPYVDAGTDVFDMMNAFQEGRSHLAVVMESADEGGENGDAEGKKEQEEADDLLASTRSAPANLSAGAKPPATENGETSAHVETAGAAKPTRAPARIVPAAKGTFKSVGPKDAPTSAIAPTHTIVLDPNSQYKPRRVVGIVTLEDVVEELIGEEIVDETDVFLDVATGEKVTRKPWNTLKSVIGILSPHLLANPKAAAAANGAALEHHPGGAAADAGSTEGPVVPTAQKVVVSATAQGGLRSAAWTGAGVKVLATEEAQKNAKKLGHDAHIVAAAAVLDTRHPHLQAHVGHPAAVIAQRPKTSPDVLGGRVLDQDVNVVEAGSSERLLGDEVAAPKGVEKK